MRMLGSVSMQQLAIADFLGRLDRCQGQRPADAVAALLGLDIEALHLADALAPEGADADAAGRPAIDFGKEQAALRRRIGAGQRGHFLVEILEGQIDAEPGRVVAEELADLLEGFAVVGGKGAKGDGHAMPGS